MPLATSPPTSPWSPRTTSPRSPGGDPDPTPAIESRRPAGSNSPSPEVEVVADDAKCDGTFPLITNDRTMTPAGVLGACKYQPNLERRHAQLKGHQLVAPVYVKDPVRIEGLLCCHFFALIVQALRTRWSEPP